MAKFAVLNLSKWHISSKYSTVNYDIIFIYTWLQKHT